MSHDLSEERQTALAEKLQRLLMLIIDERSMLSSETLAAAERNVRHCIYGQQNTSESWGGLPVVLLFGDDYQLLPVSSGGAIQGYAKITGRKEEANTMKESAQQLLESEGDRLFIEDMVDDVFMLTKNFRVTDEEFKGILDRLRVGECDEDDAERLMKCNLFHYTPEQKELIENHPGTVWLYTKNVEKNQKNMEKLVELSNKTGAPVARLKCHWFSNRIQGEGCALASRSHFRSKNLVVQTDFCVGAKVALSGINIVPEVGLYNGARGTVIDIVYDDPAGPNNKDQYHLPKYVVVDFPGLRLPDHIQPWDENNPTVSDCLKRRKWYY